MSRSAKDEMSVHEARWGEGLRDRDVDGIISMSLGDVSVRGDSLCGRRKQLERPGAQEI